MSDNIVINRQDSLFPYTYTASTSRFNVLRHEGLKQTLLNINIGINGEQVSLWLSDKEMDALSTMLRDAHDTSIPLFETMTEGESND